MITIDTCEYEFRDRGSIPSVCQITYDNLEQVVYFYAIAMTVACS